MPALRSIATSIGGALLLVCFLLGPDRAQAQSGEPVKVRAEGSARGTNLRARDDAIAAAKSRAVQLWLESLLGSPPSSAFEPIFGQPDYYVQTFRILDLDAREGSTYVDIEAYLHEWALKADAATVLFRERAEPPRVALLIVEERVDEGARRFQGDSRLAAPIQQILEDRGFSTISPDAILRRYSEREILGLITAGPAALARCAREHRADAVVVVQGTLDVKSNTEGVGPLRARADLEVLVAGATTPRLYEHAVGAAEVNCLTADEGLAFALDDAIYKIRDHVLVGAALAGAQGGSSAFELTLEDAPSWEAVEWVGDRLREYPGVVNLEVLAAEQGYGLIRFGYDGSIGDLVRTLEQAQSPSYALEARTVVERNMRFRFVDP